MAELIVRIDSQDPATLTDPRFENIRWLKHMDASSEHGVLQAV